MKDKIKKIKYSRLSKEERTFIDAIDCIKPHQVSDNIIRWYNTRGCVFEQNTKGKSVWVNRTLWCMIVSVKNDWDIEDFIYKMFHVHLNILGYKIDVISDSQQDWWDNLKQYENVR